jgi:hypothetical protein
MRHRLSVHSVVLLIMLALVGRSAGQTAATPIVYTVTGEYAAVVTGSDLLGLVGARFVLSMAYDTTEAPQVLELGPPVTSVVYTNGVSSLTLTGTAGGVWDGTFPVASEGISITADAGGTTISVPHSRWVACSLSLSSSPWVQGCSPVPRFRYRPSRPTRCTARSRR